MKILFQKRVRPENVIENEIKRVKFPSCNKVQTKASKNTVFSYLSLSCVIERLWQKTM